MQNVKKNKTIQKKSWVEESLKQDWKRNTQHKWRFHAKNQNEQYCCEENMDRTEGPRELFTSDSITLSQAVTHVAYTWKSTVRRK